MTQDKTIVLHTYTDMLEAKMIQDKLKENGIDSFINDEKRIFEKDKVAAEKIISV